MQTVIYFIRHAEPNYNNHDDFTRELTPKGMIDSELVTKYLSDKNIELVLSSPYRRALDTVNPTFTKKLDFHKKIRVFFAETPCLSHLVF